MKGAIKGNYVAVVDVNGTGRAPRAADAQKERPAEPFWRPYVCGREIRHTSKTQNRAIPGDGRARQARAHPEVGRNAGRHHLEGLSSLTLRQNDREPREDQARARFLVEKAMCRREDLTIADLSGPTDELPVIGQHSALGDREDREGKGCRKYCAGGEATQGAQYAGRTGTGHEVTFWQQPGSSGSGAPCYR